MSNTVNRQVWEKILGDQKAIQDFRSFHWEGNFFEYLDLVKKNPSVTRNAFQRMYDLLQGLPGEKRVAQLTIFED